MSEQKEKTDLVSALRRQADEIAAEGHIAPWSKTMTDAANEIERLRKLCRRFADAL